MQVKRDQSYLHLTCLFAKWEKKEKEKWPISVETSSAASSSAQCMTYTEKNNLLLSFLAFQKESPASFKVEPEKLHEWKEEN